LNYQPSSVSKVSSFPIISQCRLSRGWIRAPFRASCESNGLKPGCLGRVTEGLILHPDNEHIIYPLGTTIVLRHIITRTQHFLRGHDNDISVISVSNSGKYIASGQKTHQGF
jgi:hypothetical protein